jgi:hypothetical protein
MAAKKTTKKAKKKSATPKKAAAKKTGRGGRRGPRGPRAGSKTAFILSQPLDMLAKDVIEAGKKAGHVFSDKYVWAVRSANKAKGGAAKVASSVAGALVKRGPGRPRKNAAVSTALAAGGSLDAQFARMALDLGIARAESILRKVRDVLDGLKF